MRNQNWIHRHNLHVAARKRAIKATVADLIRRARISEKLFTAQVLELAGYTGWKRAHFRPARVQCGKRCAGEACKRCKGSGYVWRTPVQGDGKGFPDLVLVRAPRLIFAELKADGEEITDPDQQAWFEACAALPGAETYLWRPKDFEDIREVLTRKFGGIKDES